MPWLHLSQSFLTSLPHSSGGIEALIQLASDFVSSFDVLWSDFDGFARRATEPFEWLFARFPK